ncbi:MAG: hypothetical protein H7330_02535 [Hymenobacteraceae bacterium]|nr:hypothetical protein [Hymenobacteraceae bacterium]
MPHLVSLLRSSLLAAGSILALTTTAYAQSAATFMRPVPSDMGALTLKVMPLGLADPWTPTFQSGAEYRITPLWGIEASYGIQIRNLGWGRDRLARLNDRYHKLHLEARHYLGGSPFYLAAAGFRVNHQFDQGAGLLYQDGQTFAYASAHVRRTITGGVLKAGVVLPLDAHWRLDVAGGAGLRTGRISYGARELQPLAATSDYYPQPECGFGIDWSPTTAAGTFRRPTLALDVKLGYTFPH